MKRREFLRAGALGAAAFSMTPLLFGDSGKKRILCFDLATICEHEPAHIDDGKTSFFARMMTEDAKKLGYEVDYTKDGSVFEKDLSPYAAFAFYTCDNLAEPMEGQIPLTPEGEKNLLDAIRGGAGFIGLHSTVWTWTRGNPKSKLGSPFNRMIGGGVLTHGNQQETDVTLVEPIELPTLKALGAPKFRHFEEWYSLYDFNPDIHVLCVQETKGMKTDGLDSVYARAAYPCVWIRKEGKGRCAYASFGHDKEKLTAGPVPGIVNDLLSFVTGHLDLDLTPNLKDACPGADQFTGE